MDLTKEQQLQENLSELRAIPDEIKTLTEDNKVLMQAKATQALFLATNIEALLNDKLENVMEGSDRKHKFILWTAIVTFIIAAATLVFTWWITRGDEVYKESMTKHSEMISESVRHTDSIITQFCNKQIPNQTDTKSLVDSLVHKP